MSRDMRRICAFIGAAALTVAVSSGPALAKCKKIHPIFGVTTYVDDKYCPKKPAKAARKTTKKIAKPKSAAPANRLARIGPKADPEIREMQSLLALVGYDPGPADGLKGPQTKAAALAFKRANNLKAGADAEETVDVLKRITGKR